eukprot:SAG31_NODE_6339_length_2057_cov_3.064351_2_plen_45_part_01
MLTHDQLGNVSKSELLHHFLRGLGSRRLVAAGDGVLGADPMRHAR